MKNLDQIRQESKEIKDKIWLSISKRVNSLHLY